MKLSTRSRYGVRALVEIGMNKDDNPVNLSKIAENTDISIKYLEQIMRKLKKAGFVKTIQGVKGGFVLAKKREEINLKAVLEILESKDYPVECVRHPESCERLEKCFAHHIWSEIYNAISSTLEKYTLAELIKLAEEFKK